MVNPTVKFSNSLKFEGKSSSQKISSSCSKVAKSFISPFTSNVSPSCKIIFCGVMLIASFKFKGNSKVYKFSPSPVINI